MSVACPYCGHPKSKHKNDWPNKHHGGVNRRRQCLNWRCGKRFTTNERVYDAGKGRGKSQYALADALGIDVHPDPCMQVFHGEQVSQFKG